jgi:hypothetical protein
MFMIDVLSRLMKKYAFLLTVTVLLVGMIGCGLRKGEIRFTDEWNDNPQIMQQNGKHELSLNRITEKGVDSPIIEFGIIVHYPKGILGRVNVNFVYIDKQNNLRVPMGEWCRVVWISPSFPHNNGSGYFEVNDPVSDVMCTRVMSPSLKKGDYYAYAEFNGKVVSEGNLTIN